MNEDEHGARCGCADCENRERADNIRANGGVCPDASGHEPGTTCPVCRQSFHEYRDGCVCDVCHRHWWETTEWQRRAESG